MGTHEAFVGLDRIALSFSGGGFRAASFSLGCLSYLDAIPFRDARLLDRVTFISSTSGGSITSLMYASMMSKGDSFETFFKTMLSLLDGEKLLTEVMKILHDESVWKERPGKERNFINAFSLVYDRDFFQGRTLGDLFHSGQPFHLEEICVNSTEFTNGLAFRFHAQQPDQGLPQGLVGNAYIHFLKSGKSISNKLRLADILASSSCFPSGFEPLIFPDDYTHADLSREQILSKLMYKANPFTLRKGPGLEEMVAVYEGHGLEAEFKATMEVETETPETLAVRQTEVVSSDYDFFCGEAFKQDLHVGIMDGGIVDNQAVDAFSLAQKRRKKAEKPVFDMYMPCDVTSYLMDGYCLPMQKKGFFASRSLFLYALLLILLFLVPVSLLFLIPATGGWRLILAGAAGVFTIPAIVLMCLWVKHFLWDRLWRRSKQAFYMKHIPGLFRLSLGAVIQMIQSRIKSVVMLSGDVYLKHIRRMYYNSIYADDALKNRIVHTMIYDLSEVKATENKKGPVPPPNQILIDVAEKARRMPTTLWFDPNHKEEKLVEALIATGQFTTCYNLLKFLRKKQIQGPLNQELLDLMAKLDADWQAFNQDPYRMLKSGS